MSVEEGSEQSPLPPPLADATAFKRLVIAQGKKPAFALPPKFVKKLDDVLVIALPPEQPMQIAVSLVDQALVEQFARLWPSPRTIEN